MNEINLLDNTHVLIAGTTGAGKSVLINQLLDKLVNQAYLILIDPKGCELRRYKKHPHVLAYAVDPGEILNALDLACKYMNRRFKEMSKRDSMQSERPHIYILIDEYVDIKLLLGAKAEKPLQQLLSKARASNIHIFLCTQRPTNDVIKPLMRACFTAFVGLRTSTAQESRNIIGASGCEQLPQYGYCYYKSPKYKNIQLLKIEKPAQ